jgi:hypothetical protein
MIPCFANVILCIICCIKFYFFAAVIIFAGAWNYYPWRIKYSPAKRALILGA